MGIFRTAAVFYVTLFADLIAIPAVIHYGLHGYCSVTEMVLGSALEIQRVFVPVSIMYTVE